MEKVPKPAWYKDSEPIDFKLVNDPLEEVIREVSSRLEKEGPKLNYFYFVIKGLLDSAFQTYKAIRKLVVDDPKYPAQAHILGRSLIDTLFTVVMLIEDPKVYSRQYEAAGYRAIYEEYDREQARYGHDSEWKQYLDDKQKLLDALATRLNLSQTEKANPIKHLNYWPIPSRMLKSKSLSSDRQDFLEEVYDWQYRGRSGWSHQGWTGMAISMFADAPEDHWEPGKFESDAVYIGLLFLLMILSEIDVVRNYGYNQKLKYVWTILKMYYEEADDYYKLRYDALLK